MDLDEVWALALLSGVRCWHSWLPSAPFKVATEEVELSERKSLLLLLLLLLALLLLQEELVLSLMMVVMVAEEDLVFCFRHSWIGLTLVSGVNEEIVLSERKTLLLLLLLLLQLLLQLRLMLLLLPLQEVMVVVTVAEVELMEVC